MPGSVVKNHRRRCNIGSRKIVHVRKKQKIYAPGALCDALFYIQKGKVKLTVVSKAGKEATIAS